MLSIPCRRCNFVSTIDTDTRMETEQQRGPRPFSSNRKAVLGKSVTSKLVQVQCHTFLLYYMFNHIVDIEYNHLHVPCASTGNLSCGNYL